MSCHKYSSFQGQGQVMSSYKAATSGD